MQHDKKVEKTDSSEVVLKLLSSSVMLIPTFLKTAALIAPALGHTIFQVR
jgi:hypothetical protein